MLTFNQYSNFTTIKKSLCLCPEVTKPNLKSDRTKKKYHTCLSIVRMLPKSASTRRRKAFRNNFGAFRYHERIHMPPFADGLSPIAFNACSKIFYCLGCCHSLYFSTTSQPHLEVSHDAETSFC